MENLQQPFIQTIGDAAVSHFTFANLTYLDRTTEQFAWVSTELPKAALQEAWRDPVQEELADYIVFSRKDAHSVDLGFHRK